MGFNLGLTKSDIPVVVCSQGSGVNALGIMRSIGKLGGYCTLLTTKPDSLAAMSKYCNEKVIVEMIAESIEKGLRSCINGSVKPVLFFDNDEMMEMAAMSMPFIEDMFNSVVPFNQLGKLVNKQWQYDVVKKLELATPKSWFPIQWGDIEKIKLAGKRLIAKPVSAAASRRFNFKVLAADNGFELCEKLESMGVHSPDGLIIQEMIEGSDCNVWFALCNCDNNGEIEVLTGRKLLQSGSGSGGVLVVGVLERNKKVEDYSRFLLSKIGYVGIVGVEFKYDVSCNEYYYIEISARTERFHTISELSNYSIAVAGYMNAIKERYYHSGGFVDNGKCWVDFGRLDLLKPRVLKELFKLLPRFLFKKVKFSVLDVHDLKPSITASKQRAFNVVRRVIKKLKSVFKMV